jgi:hypothetical protein
VWRRALDHAGFSGDDLRLHERGYPALLDIAIDMPGGVFSPLRKMRLPALSGSLVRPVASIVGASLRQLTSAPAGRLFGMTSGTIAKRASLAVLARTS